MKAVTELLFYYTTFLYRGCQIQINYSETVAISFDHKEATASGAVVLTPLRGCG